MVATPGGVSMNYTDLSSYQNKIVILLPGNFGTMVDKRIGRLEKRRTRAV